MSSAPYMQLYVADYMADTMHLTTEQHGAYLLLLMAMWRNGAVLPNDPKKLARIAGVSTRRWHRIADDVLAFFQEENGVLTSRHLDRWREFARKEQGRTPLARAIRELVIERDGACCRYCGVRSGPFHIDHIEPVARGGSDDLDNLAVACRSCNLSKGAKTPEEWLQ